MTIDAPAMPTDPAELRKLVVQCLRHPSSLLLIAANSLPVFGVIVWHWDAFLLLMLYWMETVVILFWTVMRIGIMPPASVVGWTSGGRPMSPGAAARAVLFICSWFCAGHFVFLWVMFSGPWSRKIDGVSAFFDQTLVKSGLWAPLLVLFLSRGAAFFYQVLKPHLLRRRGISARPDAQRTAADAMTLALFARIFIMQFVVVFGGWFVMFLGGSVVPFILLIALKTAIDLAIHVLVDLAAMYPALIAVRPKRA